MKYYVLIFSALVLVACGRNKSAETDLSRAKSFMRVYPDSALYILQRLEPSKLPKRSTVAQYSLLYSEALDKNAIDLTSDSLIRPAVEYYMHHGSKIDKAKSWYYLARIYENNGDIDNAVRSYVEAQKYMVETRAHRLLAMLYANVGNLYVQQNSFEDAERMYDEAISAYQGLNTVNEAYVMCDKARLLQSGLTVLNQMLSDSVLSKKADQITLPCQTIPR